jgi:spermidine/putrescine transport system permease protein
MKRGLGIYAAAIYGFLHLPFITLAVLGGGRTVMIGNLVQNQFTTARDWPFGSAVSLALMAIVAVLVVVFLRGDSEELA